MTNLLRTLGACMTFAFMTAALAAEPHQIAAFAFLLNEAERIPCSEAPSVAPAEGTSFDEVICGQVGDTFTDLTLGLIVDAFFSFEAIAETEWIERPKHYHRFFQTGDYEYGAVVFPNHDADTTQIIILAMRRLAP